MPLLIVPLCKVSAVASDWDGWISGVCSLALRRRSISAQHTDATVSAATLRLRAEIKRAFFFNYSTKKKKKKKKKHVSWNWKGLFLSPQRWASMWCVLIIWISERTIRSSDEISFFIDYFSVLQKYWLIRWIEASVRSTALTSNPFPLIKGNRVN